MVHWTRPRISNGHVTHYIVRVLDTSENVTVNSTTQFTYTVVHLRSYFLYSVIVSACTVGGCGDSGVGMARTLPSEPKGQPSPTATVVSSSSLRVRWESPEYPNGAILRYELFRSIVEEPVNENFTGPTPFVRIYQGQVKSFVDTGLGIYSLQRYQVNQCAAFMFVIILLNSSQLFLLFLSKNTILLLADFKTILFFSCVA